jgi:predicted nucleic acid-binding protein
VTAACDTSLLIPVLTGWHAAHEDAVRVMSAMDVKAVPAHVLLETYSVLTRMPAPHRFAPADAESMLTRLTLEVIDLPANAHRGVVSACARRNIAGGAVYDALVGATAAHHRLSLVTRDRRALPTYDAVGARYAVV